MTPHISVCICTYRRPELLERLLRVLQRQQTRQAFTYSAVVVDNDPARSARAVCESLAPRSTIDIRYVSEPQPNIARARNAALHHAAGEFAAFIDDDEFPDDDWLHTALGDCERLQAAGVLGPVRPHFDAPPPAWVVRGRFCERPEHPTGHTLHWQECRTGNVLLRRSILAAHTRPFDERFRTGGEDSDFFLRMTAAGHVFRWSNEASVYETVPPERLRKSYMLRRAMLRGSLTMKLPGNHLPYLGRALVAIPAYLMVIPFATVLGTHAAMKYSVRLCDHAGLLMAACGIRPVRER
jgi:succinoglycan biosynthesis protein ExoM